MISLKRIIRSLSDERWTIGFIRNSVEQILDGEEIIVDWVLDKNKKRWFADPFILDVDEKEIIVLAEEVNKHYKLGKKGRISRLTIDRDTLIIKNVCPILELDTHLSFPAIYRIKGHIFICPENSESGQLKLYRYDDNKKSCSFEKIICNDPLADAVMTEYFGKQLIFATKIQDANGPKLYIYAKGDNNSLFEVKESYKFNENIARMAGHFFEFNGKIYRPTQECNIQYGHAITIQEIRKEETWHFYEVRRIYSTHPKLTVGTHTFNVYNNFIVTDALGFDRIWIRKILKLFHLLK